MKKLERSGIAIEIGIMLTKQDTERILKASEGKLLEIVEEQTPLTQYGDKHVGLCPRCKRQHVRDTVYTGTLTVTSTQFDCWSCKLSGTTPVSFLMQMGKTYPEALLYLGVKLQVVDPPRDYQELYFY